MELERWQEIRSVAEKALELPTSERAAYLEAACGEDEQLYREVEALLAVSDTQIAKLDNLSFVPRDPRDIQLESGRLIGSYIINSFLGYGGMSAVYRADDPRHGRKVALKVLATTSTPLPLHEHRILGRLKHPNIATLYDSGMTDEGYRFLALEYVEGMPITTYCEHTKSSLRERLGLFIKICNAVQFAHQNLIVHRDLKPSNIVVTKDGEPKLLDFGIAKLLPGGDSTATLTQAEKRPFTLAFASPEQIDGGATTTTSDTYSLGVLLCLLLTGRYPYQVETKYDLPWAIRRQQPEIPSLLAQQDQNLRIIPDSIVPIQKQDLRGDLDAIILKALRKDPDDRYQTVRELAEDIDRFLSDRPVVARGASRLYRAQKLFIRYRAPLLTTLILITGLMIASVVFFFQERKTVEQRDRAQREAQRAEDLTTFLISTFESPDPWTSPDPNIKARDLLDSALLRIKADTTDPASQIKILSALGTSFLHLDLPTQAEDAISNALSICNKNIAELCSQRGNLYARLGQIKTSQARFEEAEKAVAKALESERTTFSENSPEYAFALTQLAILQREKGQYREAQTSFNSALQIYSQHPGKTSDEYLTTKIHLANMMAVNGSHAEADSLLEEVLSVQRERPGYPRLAIAATLKALCDSQTLQGKLGDAQESMEEAVAITKDVLGESSISHGLALVSLSTTRLAIGEFDKAEKDYRFAHSILSTQYGENHPASVKALQGIAAALQGRGAFDQAVEIYRDVIARREKLFDEPNPDTGIAYNNLGLLLDQQGNLKEGGEAFRKALDIALSIYGDQHMATAMARSNLAGNLVRYGKLDEAYALFEGALNFLTEEFGQNHIGVATTYGNLGFVLEKQGRLQEAMEKYQQSVASYLGGDFASNPNLAASLINMGRLHMRLQNLAEAEAALNEAITVYEQTASVDHPEKFHAMSLLGYCLHLMGRNDEAEPLLRDSHRRLVEILGESAPKTTDAEGRLSDFYRSYPPESGPDAK